MNETNKDCEKCFELISSCGYINKDCQYKMYQEENKQLQQLKQENQYLKNEIKIYKSVQWDIKTVDELYTTKALKDKESEIYEIYREQKKQLINTEQKLEKIKEHCEETLQDFNDSSGTNAYSGGRCIEAGQILMIIKGEE